MTEAKLDEVWLRGIDVSSHQQPHLIEWAKLAATHRWIIARAAYGTKRDAHFREHITRARDAGLQVGAYLFFRPQQDAKFQHEVFEDCTNQASIGPGDIVPTLDVEQNIKFDGPVTPERYAPAELICAAWQALHGGAMVYTNPSMWPAIGNPSWLGKYHLWISHWGVPSPQTPRDFAWHIWQWSVAPLPGIYPHELDLNVARALPLIPQDTSASEPTVAPEPFGVDWAELRAERDAAIREDDES